MSSKFCLNVPEDIQNFVGRETELNSLHQFYIQQSAEAQNNKVLPWIVISGISGIGKTSLAVRYVRKYFEIYFDNIIWINGESEITISNSFKNLAQRLGHDQDYGQVSTAPSDFIKLLPEIFSKFNESKILLVFDNAGDLSEIKGLLPRVTSNFTKPFLLLTSRSEPKSQPPSSYQKNMIKLSPFTKSESIEYFNKRFYLNSEIERSYGTRIAESLLNFPLAMHFASIYLKNTVAKDNDRNPSKGVRKEVKAYSQILQSNQYRLLSFDDLKYNNIIDDYEKAVRTVWLITSKDIKLRNGLAHKILCTVCYFDPVNIPIKILLWLKPKSTKADLLKRVMKNGSSSCEVRIHDAIELLLDFGLIDLNVSTDSIRLHSLLQKVVRDHLEKKLKFSALKNALHLIEIATVREEHDSLLTFKHANHLAKCITESQTVRKSLYDQFLTDVRSRQPNSLKITGEDTMNELLLNGKYEEAEELYQTKSDNSIIYSHSFTRTFKFKFAQSVFTEIQKCVQSGSFYKARKLSQICQRTLRDFEIPVDVNHVFEFQNNAKSLNSISKLDVNSPLKIELISVAYYFYKIVFHYTPTTPSTDHFENICGIFSEMIECIFIARKFEDVQTMIEHLSSQFFNLNESENLNSIILFVDLLDNLCEQTKELKAGEVLLVKEKLFLAVQTQYKLVYMFYKERLDFVCALSVGRGLLDCLAELNELPQLLATITDLRSDYQKLCENCNIIIATVNLDIRLTQIPEWIFMNSEHKHCHMVKGSLLQSGFQIYLQAFNICIANASQLFEITRQILSCSLALGQLEEIQQAAEKLKSWLGCQGPEFKLGLILPTFAKFFARFAQMSESRATLEFARDLEKIVSERFGWTNSETMKQMAYLSEILKIIGKAGINSNSASQDQSQGQSEDIIHHSLSMSRRWREVAVSVKGRTDRQVLTFFHNIAICEYLLEKDKPKFLEQCEQIFGIVNANSKNTGYLLVLSKLHIEMKHLGCDEIAQNYADYVTGILVSESQSQSLENNGSGLNEPMRSLIGLHLCSQNLPINDPKIRSLEDKILEMILV